MAHDAGGDVVIEPCRGGDGADDVVRALNGQPAAALVEKQGGAVGVGPVGAFVQPGREVARSWGWIGISRTFSPLPQMRRMALRADRRTSSVSRPTISAIRAPA